MKVLIFSTYDGAVLERIVYEGLCSNIGAKNTYLYKPNKVELDFSLEPFRKQWQLLHQDETLERLDEFDHIIFFNGAYFNSLFDKVLNRRTSTKKHFIDGSDDFFVKALYKSKEISNYFKRELRTNVGSSFHQFEWQMRYGYEMYKASQKRKGSVMRFSKWEIPIAVAKVNSRYDLKPFPVTVPYSEMRAHAKKKLYDLSFVATLNTPNKRYYNCKLLELQNEYSKSRMHLASGESTQQYIDSIAASKVGVSVLGVGKDTYRYWDTPYFGSALLAQRVPVFIPNNFEDGKSALFFDTYEELKQKFERYVIMTNEWREIRKEGKRHFTKYHTPEMRVKNLLMKYLN